MEKFKDWWLNILVGGSAVLLIVVLIVSWVAYSSQKDAQSADRIASCRSAELADVIVAQSDALASLGEGLSAVASNDDAVLLEIQKALPEANENLRVQAMEYQQASELSANDPEAFVQLCEARGR